MKINYEDIEFFNLIDLATNGNSKAKWEIIWRFNNLIISNAKINGKYSQDCQEYIEMAVFKGIDKYKTLKEIKKFKNF